MRLRVLALFTVAMAGFAVPARAADWGPLLENLTARPIGPVTMGGRISDLAVYEKEPRIFYVASAAGGLFKSENAGLTMKPLFERENTISIGAVAIAPNNPNDVWVGTGEASSRNSVAWGDGVYHSVDGGATWTNVGLAETQQISKINVDPRDPKVVVVGAIGRLWGPNKERGIYRTEDAGKTWRPVLQLNENTGCIDLVRNPKNPNEMLAAMWQRRRYAWDFVSGGPGSGLYRSRDGGKSWSRITRGIPEGDLGRIGLNYFYQDPKIVVATIEYRPNPAKEPGRPADNGVVRNNAGGTFISRDGGYSWQFTNAINPRPFYFSMPRIDPNDANRIYVPGANMSVSTNGGKTFSPQDNNVHPDYHAMWINPTDSNHIYVGTDGGMFESRDKGLRWRHLNGMAIGQYYAVAVDMRRPYWIYGGLQDNQCWGTPTQTSSGAIRAYNADTLGGGDGFYCAADPNDWSTVYSESQGGAMQRIDLITGQGRGIRPRPEAGERARFNWSTPFFLSPHNSKTLYVGANRIYKSVNRGDSYEVISPDLTTNNPLKQSPGKLSVTPENTGAEMHCTITTLSESTRKPGLIWAGTDDGLVHVTQNDGNTWTNVTANITGVPANTWVSRVLASKWADGRAYVTFDGHRSNDFNPYVFVTEDFGKTWKSLSTGIPVLDCVYVVREGERNPDLLFLGSELSLRISLDRGESWTRFRSNDFPTVAIHDLLVHPRELDLVIATHGKSLYTLDVSGLEQLTKETLALEAALFEPQDVLLLGRISNPDWTGEQGYRASNTQPGTRIMFYLKAAAKDTPKLVVSDAAGKTSVEIRGVTNKAGLNVVSWNGRLDRGSNAGDYRVTLTVDGKDYVQSVRVEPAYLVKG